MLVVLQDGAYLRALHAHASSATGLVWTSSALGRAGLI